MMNGTNTCNSLMMPWKIEFSKQSQWSVLPGDNSFVARNCIENERSEVHNTIP